MNALTALETAYAGCLFRSRLEARWAVFFEAAGIDWQYEPQGYAIGEPAYRHYLPDFYLPEQRLWVEVKGSQEQMNNQLMLDATVPGWGLPADPYGGQYNDSSRNSRRILILGPVPVDTVSQPVHATTWFHKGDVTVEWSHFAPGDVITGNGGEWLGGDYAGPAADLDLVTTCYYRKLQQHPLIRNAYTRARSARFEHGRRG